MQDKPYDHLVKLIWKEIMEHHRRSEVQREIKLAAMFSDFWAWPGRKLPGWMGKFAEIAGKTLLVGESVTGYLSEKDLQRALLKLYTAYEEASNKLKPAASRAMGRQQHGKKTEEHAGAVGLVVAEHISENMLHKLLMEDLLERREAGFWVYNDRLRIYIISVTELEFRDETAVVHLFARGEHQGDAVAWLIEHDAQEVNEIGARIYQEIETMNTQPLRKGDSPYRKEMTQAILNRIHRNFTQKALQEGLRRGRQEGIKKGLRKGIQEGIQAGRQEGIQEGSQTGRQEGQRRIWKLKKNGEP